MTPRHRLVRAALLSVFVAAALGRAELGADTEASVIFTPAFALSLPPALIGGWLLAGQFGRTGAAGWMRAALAGLIVLGLTGMVAGVIGPLLGGAPVALRDALEALANWPLAWGAAMAGVVATQVIALRQGRDQSRK